MTIKAVCIHVHMSDNRRMLCDAEHSWLPVDAALNWEDEETFLNKLFLHSQRFRGYYLMFLIAAYPSDYEKPGQLPVSEVLMDRSRLDIHNFFNPYVFEVRDSAIVTIQHL